MTAPARCQACGEDLDDHDLDQALVCAEWLEKLGHRVTSGLVSRWAYEAAIAPDPLRS